MSANPQYVQHLYRENIASLFTPITYDPGSRMFFTSDSYIGFGWVSNPMTGASDATADKLNMLLSMQYPAGTVMSFSLFASPDVAGYLNELLRIRVERDFGGNPVLESAMRDKAAFIQGGTAKRVNDRVYSILRDFLVVITVKIPTSKSSLPTDKEWRQATDLRTGVEKGLESLGLGPVPIDETIYLHVLGTMLNWGPNASWRGGTVYDPNSLLNEQLVDLDTNIAVDDAGLWLGQKRVKVLSPKRYPDFVSLPMMHLMVGDVQYGKDGIAGNFLSTMNVFFPDASTEREKQNRKRTVVNYQAIGPVAGLNPALRQKKADFDTLFESVDNGDRIIRIQHSFVLFEDDEERATAATTGMISYYRDIQWHVQDDRYVTLPLFVNSLPFGADPDPKAVSFLRRHRTVASAHAANLAPVVSDWKGTKRPVLTYYSRNGQVMGVDLFDSSSNFNFIVAAQSGAGKSFWANDCIVSYLSTGAKVYVIDVGRSYLKICEVLDGEFLVFSKDSDLCLNPFELVKEFEEEGSMLTDMIKAMAAPTTKLGDWETSVIQKIISDLWATKGNSLVIDDVAAALCAHPDARARDIGDQLFAFTSKGEFGRWFVGKNNVAFNKNLTVLELEELKGKPHLQVIVLLQLIYQITQDLYLGDRSIPKLILVDESWDLFNKGDVAAFMISAYRRARKYGGAIGIITQSISDLYANETVGLPMLENSAWLILLAQKGESIDFMEKAGRLSLNSAGFRLLKTVQTVRGRYSEIFLYTSTYNGAVAAGIGRLIVSRFSQLLYSTDARDLTAINKYRTRGMSLPDAIQAVVQEEQQQ